MNLRASRKYERNRINNGKNEWANKITRIEIRCDKALIDSELNDFGGY